MGTGGVGDGRQRGAVAYGDSACGDPGERGWLWRGCSGVGVLWVRVESGMAGREEWSPTVIAHAVALVGEAGCSGGAVEWSLG